MDWVSTKVRWKGVRRSWSRSTVARSGWLTRYAAYSGGGVAGVDDNGEEELVGVGPGVLVVEGYVVGAGGKGAVGEVVGDVKVGPFGEVFLRRGEYGVLCVSHRGYVKGAWLPLM